MPKNKNIWKWQDSAWVNCFLCIFSKLPYENWEGCFSGYIANISGNKRTIDHSRSLQLIRSLSQSVFTSTTKTGGSGISLISRAALRWLCRLRFQCSRGAHPLPAIAAGRSVGSYRRWGAERCTNRGWRWWLHNKLDLSLQRPYIPCAFSSIYEVAVRPVTWEECSRCFPTIVFFKFVQI